MKDLVILLMWTLLGLLCSILAKRRGRNPYGWFFIGLLGGVLGILLLFLLPKIVPATAPSPPPDVKPRAARFWYYLDNDNHSHGPMSLKMLQEALDKGEITKESFVWNEDLEKWEKYSDLHIG